MDRLRNVFHAAPLLLACIPALAAEPAWKLAFDGFGPIKTGMRFEQVNQLLGKRLVRTAPQLLPTAGCEQIPLGEGKVWLMFTGDVLTRIDVADGAATALGIRTGDDEARVRAAYPGATSEPDPDGGHYLTAVSSDGKHAMRFETSGGKVTLFYAGAIEQVRYTEGCL